MSAASPTPEPAVSNPAPAPSGSAGAASGSPAEPHATSAEGDEQLDPMIDGIGPADGEGSIRIIREKDSKFLLNHEGLRAIMDRAKKISNKVVVVSLVGDFRTGKSFLLNMFLRYLRYHESLAAASKPSSAPPSSEESVGAEHKSPAGEDAPAPAPEETVAAAVKAESPQEDNSV